MKVYADGWHVIGGYDCFVEAGKVVRAKIGSGNDQQTAYPYRAVKDGGYTEAVGVSVDTLRAGLTRGTYTIK